MQSQKSEGSVHEEIYGKDAKIRGKTVKKRERGMES